MTALIAQRERAGGFEEAVRTALDSFRSSTWSAMPAIITRVDLERMVVNAQVSIRDWHFDALGPLPFVEIPELLDLPIVFPRGGGVALTFPVKPGDETLVVFANRCIDAWWQMGGVQNPIELRPNELSDGFAFMGVSSIPRVLADISTNSAQLRTTSGTTFVEVTEGGGLNLRATGDISIVAGGNITITGASVTINP